MCFCIINQNKIKKNYFDQILYNIFVIEHNVQTMPSKMLEAK